MLFHGRFEIRCRAKVWFLKSVVERYRHDKGKKYTKKKEKNKQEKKKQTKRMKPKRMHQKKEVKKKKTKGPAIL